MNSFRKVTEKKFRGGAAAFIVLSFLLLGSGCEQKIPEEFPADTFSVVYNGNGSTGGSVPESGTYEGGFTVTVAGNSGGLARTNYVFSGWNTAADGTGTDRAAGSTFAMGTSNMTLYAKWLSERRFVVLDSAGNAWYGADGANWQGPNATGLTVGNGIVHANGLFIAVGQDGSNYGSAASSDGIVWTKQNLGGVAAQLTRIGVDSTEKLLAAGFFGITYEIFVSSDGLNWTGPFSTGIPNAAGPAWSGSAWFLSSNNGSSWKKSADGQTWDGSGLGTAGMYQANAVGSIGGRILLGGGAPGGTNMQTVTSSDGAVTFGSVVNVAGAAGYINAFLADDETGRIFALGSGGSAQVNYSDDFGATWTASTGTGSGTFKAAVKWKNGILIGDDSGGIYSSPNGASFAVSGNCGTSEIRGIACKEFF